MTFDEADRFLGPLMTWVDFARLLAQLDPAEIRWQSKPTGLRAIRVDWAGVEIQVSACEDADLVRDWLKTSFPQLKTSNEDGSILLEAPLGQQELPVSFYVSNDELPEASLNLGSVNGFFRFAPPVERHRHERPVPVAACLSVKGGTGRTTTAIAVASQWAESVGLPILVVDADLEAPGLSYIYSTSHSEILVSLEDVIALAHADNSASYEATRGWAAARLANQKIGNLVVLPLRRALDELATSGIRAEHLSSKKTPFVLADLLSEVADMMGCGGVVVDVRAGLTPISAQFALDEDVQRVVCTSLADQSLRGTMAFMEYVSRELRKMGAKSPPPLLVVNRIPSVLRDYGTDDQILDPYVSEIEKFLTAGAVDEVAADETLHSDADVALFIAKVGEIGDLQVPKRNWDGFSTQLKGSGFCSYLEPIATEWLQQFQNTAIIDPQLTQYDEQPNTAEERRGMLKNFAERIEYSEKGKDPVELPLVTEPLRALTEQSQPPIVIMEGAKGTGKTLTARYLLNKGSWANAVSALTSRSSDFDADFLPVLGSVQSSEHYQAEIGEQRQAIATELCFSTPHTISDTKRAIENKLLTSPSSHEWTDFWVDLIAWSAGFEPNLIGAGNRFISHLAAKGRRVIAIFEGVEEVYASSENPALISMLRSLLIDLPVRLRAEIGRPIGAIILARRDTIDLGVQQNRQQFSSQYKSYALTWTEDDVLELAAWTATKSGAFRVWNDEFRGLTRQEKSRALEPLWGRKLGRDEVPGGKRVQEAFTSSWVIAVLSDLLDRLAARDLIRFIKEAASAPVPLDASGFGTRLLLPSALRSAVGPTSRAKVADTQEEIKELVPIFERFEKHSTEIRAPIDELEAKEISLSTKDLDLLRTHGIIIGDTPPYEVAELFRIGLGLRHAGARYSVIGMRRRARQRASRRLL